jgi:pyroglutamyl-peptidase
VILLLTGFEPFDGARVNPSGEVARRLDGTRIGAATVVGRVLPVSFDRLPALIGDLIATTKPDALLGMGLASSEPTIRLEQFAINRAHCGDGADNDGVSPSDRPLDPDGPAARIASLSLRPVVERLRGAGIPARLSFHAGTHCCNLWLYHALGALERNHALGAPERAGHAPAAPERRGIPCGFIHLPCLPEQTLDALLPSMPLDVMVEAVRLVAAAAVEAAPVRGS